MKKAKILLYDIETSPNTSYTWGKYEQNVIDFKREWQLLTFAYKWLGDKEVKVVTRLDFKDSTDKSIAKALWDVLNEADIVVAHNGNSFDNKKARAKFIEHGLGPTSPFATVDTKLVARAHFQFNSNKLDDLGRLLGVGRKIKITQGFDLWLRCMAGEEKAFLEMARYNKQDVRLLERVYLKLRPWMNKHASVSHIEGRQEGCPKCGGIRLQSRGYSRTSACVYQRYQCQDCGGWCRSSDKSAVMSKLTKPKAVNL